ncbi:MAG: Nramp family divalent metal transporter [Parcubacteria group bacterium]|nr:Nramp family divalent metal transporter [Parcubacteria group bacterium]
MSKHLPFPKLKKSLLQLLGPSIIFVALSLNGGEMMLWPSLVANYDMRILWAVPIILFLQFFVNMEIERYTLVTGKSVERNLVGTVKWLSIVFALTVLLTLVWPAWMTTAGNLIVVVFGDQAFSDDQVRTYALFVTIALMALTFFIFRFKKTYAILEKISRIGLIVSLAIILLVVITQFRLDYFVEGLKGLFAWGYIPAELPRFDFLGALAFGGVAGVLNLVQSEWVMEKGYGAAGLSKADQKRLEFESETSKKNFKYWFKMVNREHFLLFFLANLISIFLLGFLGRILLPLGTAQGFGVLSAEIHVLNANISLLGSLFGIAAIMIFVMANLVILDVIGRLSYRLLTPMREAGKLKKLTSSNISLIASALGILILVLSLVFPSLKQPYFLLVVSASLSAITMWLYPPLLLKLNLSLPAITRPGTFRIIMTLMTTFFYGMFSLWALASFLPMVVVVLIGLVITSYQVRFLMRK